MNPQLVDYIRHIRRCGFTWDPRNPEFWDDYQEWLNDQYGDIPEYELEANGYNLWVEQQAELEG